jgi:hypothetical protein
LGRGKAFERVLTLEWDVHRLETAKGLGIVQRLRRGTRPPSSASHDARNGFRGPGRGYGGRPALKAGRRGTRRPGSRGPSIIGTVKGAQSSAPVAWDQGDLVVAMEPLRTIGTEDGTDPDHAEGIKLGGAKCAHARRAENHRSPAT